MCATNVPNYLNPLGEGRSSPSPPPQTQRDVPKQLWVVLEPTSFHSGARRNTKTERTFWARRTALLTKCKHGMANNPFVEVVSNEVDDHSGTAVPCGDRWLAGDTTVARGSCDYVTMATDAIVIDAGSRDRVVDPEYCYDPVCWRRTRYDKYFTKRISLRERWLLDTTQMGLFLQSPNSCAWESWVQREKTCLSWLEYTLFL